LGLPEDAFQSQDDDQAEPEDDDLIILPENTDTLRVWLSVDTQWRRELPAMATREIWRGLRYTEVQATITMMGLGKRQGRIFEGIIDMERAALPILNG
jgi:hypothetical protein